MFPGTKWWIGLKQVNEEWGWVDSQTVDYNTWGSYGLTQEIISTQKCICATERGKWERVSCELELASVCRLNRMFLRNLSSYYDSREITLFYQAFQKFNSRNR